MKRTKVIKRLLKKSCTSNRTPSKYLTIPDNCPKYHWVHPCGGRLLKPQLNWLIFIDHCPFLLSPFGMMEKSLLPPINTAKSMQSSFGSILTEIEIMGLNTVHNQSSVTLTCQIIMQQILLFFWKINTYTTLLGPIRLLISEIFLSKPNFHLYKCEKILPTQPY